MGIIILFSLALNEPQLQKHNNLHPALQFSLISHTRRRHILFISSSMRHFTTQFMLLNKTAMFAILHPGRICGMNKLPRKHSFKEAKRKNYKSHFYRVSPQVTNFLQRARYKSSFLRRIKRKRGGKQEIVV